MDCGLISEAEAALNRSKGLLMPLCESNPTQVLNRSSLGGVLNNLALVYEQQGRLVAAVEALEAAVAHQQFAHEQAPESNRYREFLQQHQDDLSRIRRAQTQRDGAATVVTQRQAITSG